MNGMDFHKVKLETIIYKLKTNGELTESEEGIIQRIVEKKTKQ